MASGELKKNFFKNGWCCFASDPQLEQWTAHALPAARQSVNAKENADWLRCGGTWFVGVNALPNNHAGAVADGMALSCAAVDFIDAELGLGNVGWDKAQVSICYPGYPKQGSQETEAAYLYRLNRDAAHVDGLHAEGPQRSRHLREYHGFLLGIPLTEVSAGAAPFVVWEGSHEIMREAFYELYHKMCPSQWGEIDVTQTYQAARREVFETCPRIEVSAQPGEAYLVHRLALHGVAPWRAGAKAGPDGRMIAYFRPELDERSRWLTDA